MTAGQLVCHGCFTPYVLLTDRQPEPPRQEPRTPAPPSPPVPAETGREEPWALRPAGLRIELAGGVVEVRPGGSVTLGRDARHDPRIAFLADETRLGHLSARHATVRVDVDGTAWVRDEGSTNHTYLDGRQLPSGQWTRLRPGHALRLTSSLPVTLRFLGAG
ncbi:FHA domain-containing protein [Streptomyces sp. NPDC085529]|uniref:FHA domain-containing protein n=1 Tax=Streptomyces sp. NPDC085529 TaxID=3365729 RepID=UPI0037D286FB